jgi:PBP1b-binding outer membrane lipoprotein LpoB
VSKKFLVAASLLAACAFVVGCSNSQGAATNQNEATAQTTTRPGPDNSEITTSTDSNGVKTETRVFKDHQRVSKVVVTTRNGTRTTRVYSRSGEEKEGSNVGNALEATGDAIADSAGFVADKTVDGTKKGVEVGKTVAEKTGETASKVGDKTVDGAKTVGEKTADGAKKVGSATASGAKKAGKAIKRAVTP